MSRDAEPRGAGLSPALRTLIGLAAAVIALAGLFFARELVGPLVLGAVLVIIVEPVRRPLARWGWPRWLATTSVIVVAYVILKQRAVDLEDAASVLRAHVASSIGAIARPREVFIVTELPKTRSGKIMRRLLRDVAEGRPIGDTTTLADPAVMRLIEDLSVSPATSSVAAVTDAGKTSRG